MPGDVDPFIPLSAAELAAQQMYERSPLLAPVIRDESLTLMLGPRGIGKSFTALGIARALAAGEPFLGWRPAGPRKVSYVDGELSGYDLQQRLKAFGPPPDDLDFVIGGIRGNRTPNLASGEHWRALWQPWIPRKGPSLLVIDSLSSLIEAQGAGGSGWAVARNTLLEMRKCGFAVLVVHNGSPLGRARGPQHR